MKKTFVMVLFFLILSGCFSSELMYSDDITNQEARMIQATSQIVIKKYDLEDDTSSSLDDWMINFQNYQETKRWVSVTQSIKNGRIKIIFEWAGEDNDDLILIYLLAAGVEIVNDLP